MKSTPLLPISLLASLACSCGSLFASSKDNLPANLSPLWKQYTVAKENRPDAFCLLKNFHNSLNSSRSGALSINIDYEQSRRSNFFIEQQRYGADIIETGLLLKDSHLIDSGIRFIDWGFAQQAANGSFPKTGDAVHSSSLFLEAASRSGLLLSTHHPEKYQHTLNRWRKQTERLAEWFIKADHRGQDVNLEPFTHRYFLRGAALMEAAVFTGNPKFAAYADDYISSGINLQRRNGVLPERGKFDASYQMVGLTFASRYYTTTTNPRLRDQLGHCMRIGTTRFLSEVSPSGEIRVCPNSRTATEKSRSGSRKRFDFKNATRALLFASDALKMKEAEASAIRICQHYDLAPKLFTSDM